MEDIEVKTVSFSLNEKKEDSELEKILELINTRLGKFCFQHKVPLAQWVLEKHLNPNSENPLNLVFLEVPSIPIKETDTWATWYRRCIEENIQ